MKIEQKKDIVTELKEQFEKSKVVIATDYKGLNVMTINSLRRQLKEKGVSFRVVKNTLLIRASENNDVSLIKDVFKGPSAIAFSHDEPVGPAKILVDFAKDHGKLEIKAGVMDGKVLDLSQIKVLADLPSREVLLGTLLSVFNNIPTAFVRVLNGIPQGLVNVLNSIKDQKEAV